MAKSHTARVIIQPEDTAQDPGWSLLRCFLLKRLFPPQHCLAATVGYEFEGEPTWRALGLVAKGLSLCRLQHQALLALQVSKII